MQSIKVLEIPPSPLYNVIIKQRNGGFSMKLKKYLCIALALVIFFCVTGCGSEDSNTVEPAYNELMAGLDTENAKGKLIAGYDIHTNEYMNTNIPEELLAKEPDEVGYILKFDFAAGETYRMYTGANVYGDFYLLQLVECGSGQVLAEKKFSPYFPNTVRYGYRASPSSDDLEEWIRHVYPQWAEGEAPAHDYAEATCTAPQTCTVCGKTDGDVKCHTLGNNKCSICNEPLRSEMDCHNLHWTYEENDSAAPMEGVCTRCGAAYSSEFDLQLIAGQLVAGTWKLDYYFKGSDLQESNTVATLEIKKDHTLVIHTPEQDYTFTWKYDSGYCSSVDPSSYTVTYRVTDENGNSHKMHLSHYSTYVYFSFDIAEYDLIFGR